MDDKHFEALYPENSRFEEIEKIFKFVKEGSSSQIVGIPGVGRSNLLGYLSYNRKIRIAHVGENYKWFHFVLVNFSEVRDKSRNEVIRLIFLSLLDSLKERAMVEDHKKVEEIFKQSFSSGDELIIFQGLKKTIDYLSLEKELTVILLFDRFEQYVSSVDETFFANLKTLRDRAKYRFSVILALKRPLPEILDPQIYKDFAEFLEDNIIYLPIEDKESLDFRIEYLQKATGEKVPDEIVAEIKKLTSGHIKLTRLSLEEYISKEANIKNLKEFLFSRNKIQSILSEIWNSFTPEEQSALKNIENDEIPMHLMNVGIVKDKKITIPLFEEFVNNQEEMKKDDSLVFDENTNQIKKGDVTFSNGLTSLEFKLLKFLIQNSQKVLSRDEIVEAVWGDLASTKGVTEQAIDQLIFRLRKKIEEDPNSPKHITTLKGRGFQFLP